MKRVILFGGTGFIGSYILKNLVECGYIVRVFTRNVDKALSLKMYGSLGQVEVIEGNINDKELIKKNIIGCEAIINLIGILYESKNCKFYDIHVSFAEFIAKTAHENNIKLLIHFSAMGIDNNQYSLYAKSKILGEEAVKLSFPNAVIIKPGLVFGHEDNFFNKFAKLSTVFPFLFLIGNGQTKFQPVYVNDIAKLVTEIVINNIIKKTYNIGGPRTYTLKYLMKFILRITKRRCYLINLSFFSAKFLSYIFASKIARLLLKPFIGNTEPLLTRDQVLLLQYNTTTHFNDLQNFGISPTEMEDVVSQYLEIYKNHSA